jgi:uncharacterized protein DUF4272
MSQVLSPSAYMPTPSYPSPQDWAYASPRQASRAARSFDILRPREVPVYWGPLMVPDEDEVIPQRAEDVLRRIAVLWAVALRGDGYSHAETLSLIDEQDLWDAVSPSERSFLLNESPSKDALVASVWRLESIEAMLWSLGYMDKLAWPNGQCDVPKLAEILDQIENEPDFSRPTELRCTSELLDARDLMMRLEWAARDAYLHRDAMLPIDFDWSGKSRFVPVTICEARYVVFERFYAFVWLTKGGNGTDWDNMDTST